MCQAHRKATGAYYTPDDVVRALVHWVVRRPTDRLLDPACGDGRFLTVHRNSVGVEQDQQASAQVHERVPGSLIHEGDFFAWASETRERFDCAAGNPPFIRYQRFTGEVREAARKLCARHGAELSSLSSSWAPFIVAAATLLKPGGRMAFVVPAEIGHAPYAVPVLEYLARRFSCVQIIAVQRKLFPELSEDCWLLYADGFGGSTKDFALTRMSQFGYLGRPPSLSVGVSLGEWREWHCRLRPFLLAAEVRGVYSSLASSANRLGDVARVGIGYVTGANEFFHLRPSVAARLEAPQPVLHTAVRNGKSLRGCAITRAQIERWRRRDEPVLLLKLQRNEKLPVTVRRYLDSPAGQVARTSFKCRNRDPLVCCSRRYGAGCISVVHEWRRP